MRRELLSVGFPSSRFQDLIDFVRIKYTFDSDLEQAMLNFDYFTTLVSKMGLLSEIMPRNLRSRRSLNVDVSEGSNVPGSSNLLELEHFQKDPGSSGLAIV